MHSAESKRNGLRRDRLAWLEAEKNCTELVLVIFSGTHQQRNK